MHTKLTPMMKQYMEIKKKHQSEILFFRMGDFYEMFFEDAQVASRILDIALTARQHDVPMCGIPFHAADSYISRLIKAGKRVAICEQLETVPSEGPIVKREVVRIMTPGTVIESHLLQSDDNNFLASIIFDKDQIGMSFVDISTGDFYLACIPKSIDLFRAEIAKFNPSEIVLKESDDPDDDLFHSYIKEYNSSIYRINEWYYDQDYMHSIICDVFKTASTKGLGLSESLEIVTAGSILQYLKETHKQSIEHLQNPRKILSSSSMILDEATISNLELVENQQDRTRERTLFSILNYTKTPMGRRMLERSILQPLINPARIESRLDSVQYCFEFNDFTQSLQDNLKKISDIERLISRLYMGRTFPRNFIALRDSLFAAQNIHDIMKIQPQETFTHIAQSLPLFTELAQEIASTIDDDPALSPDQGPVVRRGYNKELDHFYSLKNDAKSWILEYQEEEKERLGIATLKIKYNKVLGYFIEISKAQATNIPEDYYRKQTLVGSERYTTEKLQKFESDILSASDNITGIEKRIIENLRNTILQDHKGLQEMARILGEIDFFCSLAIAARDQHFVRPQISENREMKVNNGRHPVVERYYTKEVFIPNDIILDDQENTIKLITGPNMAGKSTYIRMAALIQLMAQIGSFVPAEGAELGIVDRIFTRIGASDNIARGESTFLVEMNETANIINNATDNSLIIMDEIGRGTSTYDGLSIAWAVVEYIQRYIRSKTLFATHYHELTSLGDKKGITNYTVLVREHLHTVEFLHKVVPGSADRSYGIHVAKLAGLPGTIINKANKILEKLERKEKTKSIKESKNDGEETEQLDIFNASNHRIIQALEKLDCNTITPVDALNELNKLVKLLKE